MGVLDVIDTNIQKTDRNVSSQTGTGKVPNNGGVLYRDLLNMLSKENDVKIVTENNYLKIFQKNRVTKTPAPNLTPGFLQSIIENNQFDFNRSSYNGGFRESGSRLDQIRLCKEVNNNVSEYQGVKTIKMFQGHESVDIQTNAGNDSKKQLKAKETLDSKDEKVDLLDLVRDKARSDLYVVNVDDELTETIKKTFEKHGCQVSVSKLEKDLIALYVLLNKKISIKKLRKLIEKGKKFGIDFCLTKTGMTSILLNKVKQIFHV